MPAALNTQDGTALRWPLHRYKRPLLRDRWFLAAVLAYIILSGLSLWQREWFGVVRLLVIFYFMGGLRNLMSAFGAGYRDD